MKKLSLLLVLILSTLKGYSQEEYTISGVFADNTELFPDEMLLLNDKCKLSLVNEDNEIVLSYSKWEFKVELSDKWEDEYIIIDESTDNFFEIHIDSAFVKDVMLSSKFKRYEVDKSVLYKGVINFEGTSDAGKEIICDFPVMLCLLPSIPELKILDIEWGIYDAEYRCYDDAYITIQIHSERSSEILGREVYANTNGKGYSFRLDIDPQTHEAKFDFCYDDSYFTFRANNLNGSVVSKDTIFIKELELANRVGDFTARKVMFYPNPVNDILYIQKENNFNGPISIYSLNGVLIKSFEFMEDCIDLSELPEGVYLLEYNTLNNKRNEFMKLIKN